MSTLNVTNLTGPSNTGVAAVLSSVNGGPISGARNRIINGDMRIDARNAGAAVTVDNGLQFPVDRWPVEDGTDAVLSAQQTTDVPTGQGFTNSLRITATTADASIGATQFAVTTQWIEGLNCSDLGWGTASASSVTASFWVKASVTGQYSCTVYNSGASRINPQPFTINVANTWEKKTVTFAGDTTGTWLTTNGRGISLNFYLALGSSLLGSSGWNGSGLYGVSGQANALASVNNTFFITGVQLEPGTVATPFERRSYGQELALCQRYYEEVGAFFIGNVTTATTYGTGFTFAVEKRAIPTMSSISQGGAANGTMGTRTPNASSRKGGNTTGPANATISAAGFSDVYAASIEL